MKKINIIFLSILCSLYACRKAATNPTEDLNAGGETTVFVEFNNAFQQPAPNLDSLQSKQHREGDVAFEAKFVTAPATINGGLGPLFNQNSCNSCHIKNGSAAFPETTDNLGGLLFRVSQTGVGMHGEPLGVDGFGGQIQTKATFGKQPEANLKITFEEIKNAFPDGENYTLRKPIYEFINTYRSMNINILSSPRIAPPIFGLGLLEAISEADILKNADVNDTDKDGVSGKPNYVWDVQKQQKALGRFGWKAGQPNLFQQAAAAYLDDMGVTNPLFLKDPSFGQPQHDGLPDDPEIDAQTLKITAFYTQSLGVPAPRRQDDSNIKQGKILFNKIGCQNCHKASFTTSSTGEFAFLNNQKIQPYTDLLLHDMGADLADNRPDFEANGLEWRTPPLWGIGLTRLVNGHSSFLHDGRARNLTEAILWHGGEGLQSRENFKKLTAAERIQLIKFLDAL